MSEQSDKEITPPTEGFLKNLAGSISSFVKQKRQNLKFKSGKTIPAPRRVCPVCTKPHDYGNREPEIQLIRDYCADCLKELRAGYTACVCDMRYAFVKSARFLAGLEGKVVVLQKKTMDLLQQKAQGNSKGGIRDSKAVPDNEVEIPFDRKKTDDNPDKKD